LGSQSILIQLENRKVGEIFISISIELRAYGPEHRAGVIAIQLNIMDRRWVYIGE